MRKEEQLSPFVRGFEDRRNGIELIKNPYNREGEVTHYSQNAHKWDRGWYDAHYRILEGKIYERGFRIY